jgi:hypothetical protein
MKAAAEAAKLAAMPYQRGPFWLRRFRQQAERLCESLTAMIAPPAAPDFVSRALDMLGRIAVLYLPLLSLSGYAAGPCGSGHDGGRRRGYYNRRPSKSTELL